MAALAAEIGLAMPGNFAVVEMQSELHQLSHARGTFHDDRPHGRLVA